VTQDEKKYGYSRDTVPCPSGGKLDLTISFESTGKTSNIKFDSLNYKVSGKTSLNYKVSGKTS